MDRRRWRRATGGVEGADTLRAVAAERFGQPLLQSEIALHGLPEAERLQTFERRLGPLDGLRHAVQLEERILVERDQIDLGQPEPSLPQTESHCFPGESGIVLAPGEPLFVSRRHWHAVDHEGGGGIVIES